MTDHGKLLEQLQAWCAGLDDEDTNSFQIRIELIANPGWLITATAETAFTHAFLPTKIMRSEHDWIDARDERGELVIAAGPHNLAEALTLLSSALGIGETL